jgi:hypothetical protein
MSPLRIDRKNGVGQPHQQLLLGVPLGASSAATATAAGAAVAAEIAAVLFVPRI